MASISVPITVNLPDDWKEQILERIKQDDDWVCVVRCKDCKHWFNAPVNDEYNSCEEDALIRHKDFFCANGELRGDL